jgi:hypothetical protein
MTLMRVGADVGLVQIQKCGTRSIKVAVREAGLPFTEITSKGFNDCKTRIVNLREPRSRLEATFRMYVNRGGLIWQLWPTDSFEEFVLSACRAPQRDVHTRPISNYIDGLSLTHILKWDFARLATLLGTGIIPQIGASPGRACEWTEAAEAAFSKAYAADLELWAA